MRFSLADKLSITIVIVGALGIILVYYICNSYKQFAYQHHTQAIQQLAYLEVNDLIDELKSNSQDLVMAIEHEKQFQRDFKEMRLDKLSQQLNNPFYQYFVTAGVLKLLKLYVLDTGYTLLSASTEGIDTNIDSELICPQLIQSALNRQGPEKLQTMSRICSYRKHPVFAVIVPFGGLNPKGYIQVITDLAYNLQAIEKSLGMPIKLISLDKQITYQSTQWQLIQENKNYITVNLPILDDSNNLIMSISLKTDMTSLNHEMQQHRNRIIALALVTTALTIFIVLLVLRRSSIPPLARIHDVLERIHSQEITSDNNNRLLFEQLLENIILLRRKSRSQFSVMILDLNQFKKINNDYGEDIGDLLLTDVELRLNTILRDSDMISWVGTDKPGHKLLPTDAKTQYRATIARLGGDEFGLVLPSAQSESQAIAVAERIVETLNKSFSVQTHNIQIKCKVGISIYPEHGGDEKLLIRNADKAMQQAKIHNQSVFIFENELTRK